jgi:hypothetical protein
LNARISAVGVSLNSFLSDKIEPMSTVYDEWTYNLYKESDSIIKSISNDWEVNDDSRTKYITLNNIQI